MKKYLQGLVIGLSLTSLVACGSGSENTSTTGEAAATEASSDEVYEISLGHSSPATEDRLEESLQEFKKAVEERSEGRIKISTFPASQLGGEREQLEAVQLGSLEMSVLSTGPFPGFFEKIMVYDLPFIFKNEDVVYEVIDGPFGEKILDNLLEETGMRGLAYGENGFRHFTNSIKPIHSPEDIKGLTFRTMENPAHMAMVEALGASPSPMAFAEVYSALQQGVMDGQETPISLIESMRYNEVNDYLTLSGHLYNPYLFIANDAFLQGLPGNLQTIITEEARNWTDIQRQMNRDQEAAGLDNLKNAGMEVVELTEEEKATFQEATAGVIDEYRDILGTELIDELLAAIEEAEKN